MVSKQKCETLIVPAQSDDSCEIELLLSQEQWFYKNKIAQGLVADGLVDATKAPLKEIDLKKSSWIDEVEETEDDL